MLLNFKKKQQKEEIIFIQMKKAMPILPDSPTQQAPTQGVLLTLIISQTAIKISRIDLV